MKTNLFYKLLMIFGLTVLFVGGITVALQKQDEVVALFFGEKTATDLASYQKRYTPAELLELRIQGKLQPPTTEPQLLPLITGKTVDEIQENEDTANIFEEEVILEDALDSEI